jgi:hypothetical protein
MTFTLTFWKIKLPAILENTSLHKHGIRDTMNLLGYTAISVGALKRVGIPDQVSSQIAAILITYYKQTDTLFEAYTTTTSTT